MSWIPDINDYYRNMPGNKDVQEQLQTKYGMIDGYYKLQHFMDKYREKHEFNTMEDIVHLDDVCDRYMKMYYLKGD